MASRLTRIAAALSMSIGGAAVLLPATAGASTPPGPYQDGTMFIADQSCACVWEVPPGGTSSPQSFAGSGESPQDVAVDPAGDLFWTQLQDGTVDERAASGTITVLASGFTPTGIAVDGSGDVYFGSFGAGSTVAGLYEIPAGGSPKLVTSRFGEISSLAVDGNGDVWAVSGSNNLIVVPPGGQGEELSVAGLYPNAVRLDSSDDLIMSTAYGDSAALLAPGAVSATTIGQIPAYADGIAVDGSDDVFVGAPSSSYPYGKVYEVTPGGTATVYVSNVADTGGLAVYPATAPASRPASSITLTTTSPSAVTTETPVTLTATVASGETGGVQFDDNGFPLGQAMQTSAGTASITTKLTAGTHEITATYLGHANGSPAVSTAVTFTSTAITSRTVLSFPAGTTVPGDQQLTVDAHVSGKGATPTGSVDFFDGNKYVGSGTLDSSANTSLQFAVTPGSTRVYAEYSGDQTFAASRSVKTAVSTTTPYAPTMATTVRYGMPRPNGSVKTTIRVTVTGVAHGTAPTGIISADDRFTCGALTPVAGTLRSVASCTAGLPAGVSKDVTVSFATGDSNYDSANTNVYVSNYGGEE